jgi:hypothetical protein
LLVLLVVCLPLLSLPAAAQTERAPGPGDTDPLLYEAIRPEFREEIVAATAGRLSRYRIEAELVGWGSPQGLIRGTVDLRFVNTTGKPLGSLHLRLYANDPSLAEGQMQLHDLAIDGVAIEPEPERDPTLVRVPLPTALPPDRALDLTVAFVATVPLAPDQGHNLFGIDPERGTWALGHWYPMVAGYDANGWHLDLPSDVGDPIFSTTALYDVRLAAPPEAIIVSSGVAIAEEMVDGLIRRRYVTGPARDIAIVADDDFVAATAEIDGTVVTSYHNPAHRRGGQIVLETGVRARAIFEARFGPYPYRKLDFAEVPLRGHGAMEYPLLMFMDAGLYDNDLVARDPRQTEFITAHEVAHQWWYGLVGSNQYRHAFIDEGLTQYVTAAVYFGDAYDPALATEQVKSWCAMWYLPRLFSQGDQILDQPTAAFAGNSFADLVYGKGCLGFAAVHAEIGDDAFFAALRDYASRHRFGLAEPADLRAAFEQAAERDLGPLWRSWFEREDGLTVYTEADYAALRAESDDA